MRTRKILIGIAVALFLSLAAGAVLAHGPEGMPPPGIFPGMGFSGIAADQQYIYVMAGGKIMQYGAGDMKLLKTVDLPQPAPPQGAPSQGAQPQGAPPQGPPPGPPCGPPMMGFHGPQAPHGLCAAGGSLYVLAGHTVYKYNPADMTVKGSFNLPEPEPPRPPQAGK